MKRLEMIASFISPYKVLADVGCDHGFLIKIAFEKGLIKKAYAIDNKLGPLGQAMANLEDYPNVEFMLQDGLSKLGKDCDVVVIAGMGGILINEIINKGFNNLKNVKRVIVEANKDSDKVRLNMYNHGYKIVKEACLIDDNKYYEIDCFERNDCEIYSSDELFFGPILLREKPDEFKNYWLEKKEKLKTISQKKDYVRRIEELFK